MLYLVATPIGNLGDITYRAVEILKNCDYILCEDTRHSQALLHHYDINKPLKSFHKFSEASKEHLILQDLTNEKKIALISDAGTPGISDPGERLVKACIKSNIPVQSIPGPCAAIAAITCSGLSTSVFQFMGFLPRKPSELRRCLQEILAYSGTSILYESAQRIPKVLSLLEEQAPTRSLAIARELTKKFEEMIRGTAAELLHYYAKHPLKGELVFLIEGNKNEQNWEDWTPEEHVLFLEDSYKLSRMEAIKMAAAQRKIPKREIYNKMIK
jgi:16S rRNA (cytidine1402-2'-O)-methyltransferase